MPGRTSVQVSEKPLSSTLPSEPHLEPARCAHLEQCSHRRCCLICFAPIAHIVILRTWTAHASSPCGFVAAHSSRVEQKHVSCGSRPAASDLPLQVAHQGLFVSASHPQACKATPFWSVLHTGGHESSTEPHDDAHVCVGAVARCGFCSTMRTSHGRCRRRAHTRFRSASLSCAAPEMGNEASNSSHSRGTEHPVRSLKPSTSGGLGSNPGWGTRLLFEQDCSQLLAEEPPGLSWSGSLTLRPLEGNVVKSRGKELHVMLVLTFVPANQCPGPRARCQLCDSRKSLNVKLPLATPHANW